MSGVGGPERTFGCMIRLVLDGLVFLAMLVPMACLNMGIIYMATFFS